jgi:hypothetical protein
MNDPHLMSEGLTIALFVIGALIAFLQAVVGLFLSLLWWEIRQLREHVHSSEAAFNTLLGQLKGKGLLNGPPKGP